MRSEGIGHKLNGFLIYMPLFVPGTGVRSTVPTGTKVRYKNIKVPIKLVFGGSANAAGQLFGIGAEMGKQRQLIRMDYHPFNAGHGGASGVKGGEISVWRDDPFHYHIRNWNQ